MKERDELIRRFDAEVAKLYRYKNKRLSSSTYKGKLYYRVIDNSLPEHEDRYVGERNHEVLQISAYQYFRRAASMLKHGCDLQDVDPNLLSRKLSRAYRVLPNLVYKAAGVINIEEWLTQDWSFNHKEDASHRYHTKAGWLTRSKSEAMLCDALTDYGIPYVYDAVIKINGHLVSPDFIILSPLDYKIYFWEHFGKMADPEYAASNARKLLMYQNAGWILGLGLFITIESDSVPLNMDSAVKLIKKNFGIPSQAWLETAGAWSTLAADHAAKRGELYRN